MNRLKNAYFLTVVTLYAVSYLISKFSGLNAAQYSFVYLLVYICIFIIFKFRGQFKAILIGDTLLLSISIILSLTIVTGIYFDNDLPFENMIFIDFINYCICVIGMMPLCKCLFTVIFQYMYKWCFWENKKENRKENHVVIFFVAFAVIFVAWIVVWMAYYPGLLNYDPWQIWQFINKDYNKHHPLLHTVLLGFCYSVGLQKGDCNSGIVLYDFIQMFIMAGIFAYTYGYVHKHVYSKIFRGIVLVFYAVFPVNSILAISSTKDVLFSGLVLLCLVLSVQVIENNLKEKRKFLIAILMVVSIVMLLFRNNAIYAFYLFIIFICAISIYKKRVFVRGVFLFSICCTVLFHISDMTLTKILDANEGNIREMFSLPSQQFGRIYNRICESGKDAYSMEIIKFYYDMNKASYNPYLADSMKDRLNIERGEDVMNYLKDALELFCKYPVVTLDAFLYLTEGSWYINDISNADIYGHGLECRQGYLLTDIKDGYNITHESKLQQVELFLEKAFSDNGYQHWPILSILFSPALYFWILIVCTIIFIKTEKWEFLLCSVFLWGLYLTCLLGPCILIRYFYPFVVCIPFILCLAKVSIQIKCKNTTVCHLNDFHDGEVKTPCPASQIQ